MICRLLFSRSRPWRPLPPRREAAPLRCLFVITSMPVGGAETLLVNMIRQMDKSQVEPEIVCLKHPGPLGQKIAGEFPVHANLMSGKWDPFVLPRLIRLLQFKDRRADVVVTIGSGDKMFWGRLAAHIAGVPVIVSALHSTGWPDGVGRLNRLLTPITDAFIAVAQSHGEFLRDVEKFPAEKVRVIRNGVDCQRFRPDASAYAEVREALGLAADTPLIGIVAALRAEKNHQMFVRVAAKLRDSFPCAHWIVVGEGPERGKIETLIGELGVEDRVHLLGTRHDTPRLVAALDLFSLCSLNEASPVSILEALACGVPVVATDVGSVGESVLEGETGHLVPSEDVDAMTAAVSSLLSDAPTRTAMGAAGRRLVARIGSLQSMVTGYQDLANELYDARAGSLTPRDFWASDSPRSARSDIPWSPLRKKLRAK